MTQKYRISTVALHAFLFFALIILSGCEDTSDSSAVDYSFEEVVIGADWKGEMGTQAPYLSLKFRSDGTSTFTVSPKNGYSESTYQAVYTFTKEGTALYSIITTEPESTEDGVNYWVDEMKVSIRSTNEIGMTTKNMNWATASLYRQ